MSRAKRRARRAAASSVQTNAGQRGSATTKRDGIWEDGIWETVLAEVIQSRAAEAMARAMDDDVDKLTSALDVFAKREAEREKLIKEIEEARAALDPQKLPYGMPPAMPPQGSIPVGQGMTFSIPKLKRATTPQPLPPPQPASPPPWPNLVFSPAPFDEDDLERPALEPMIVFGGDQVEQEPVATGYERVPVRPAPLPVLRALMIQINSDMVAHLDNAWKWAATKRMRAWIAHSLDVETHLLTYFYAHAFDTDLSGSDLYLIAGGYEFRVVELPNEPMVEVVA